jgi:hypothetical protein
MLFAIFWKASIRPLASFATIARSVAPAQSDRSLRPLLVDLDLGA